MQSIQRTLCLTFLALASLSSSLMAQKGWSKDIPYTTSWDDAIKEVRETGKLLFIYNGWEKAKV